MSGVAPAVSGPPDTQQPAPTEPAPPEKKKKKHDLLIAPVPISSPSTGSGLAVGAIMFYNPNGEPSQWISGAGLVYTSRGTKGAGVYHSMSFGQDRVRLNAQISYVDSHSNYYGIGEAAGDRDEILTLVSKQFNLQLEGLMRVFPHGYAGVRYRLRTTDGAPEGTPTATLPPPPDDQLHSTMSVFGPSLVYDTRDSSLQPHRGVYANAVWLFGIKALGDSFAHNNLKIAANAYFPFGTGTVLAVRGSLCASGGDVPFYDLCQFGASNDLRGYPSGRYRDGASWAFQAELRQHIAGKWGAVGFFGLGGIAPTFGDIPDHSALLPAAGVGVRFRPFKSNDVQLRADFAIGKNDHGTYVGISEAF
jgi:outer membrane protein assembly factor BamA